MTHRAVMIKDKNQNFDWNCAEPLKLFFQCPYSKFCPFVYYKPIGIVIIIPKLYEIISILSLSGHGKRRLERRIGVRYRSLSKLFIDFSYQYNLRFIYCLGSLSDILTFLVVPPPFNNNSFNSCITVYMYFFCLLRDMIQWYAMHMRRRIHETKHTFLFRNQHGVHMTFSTSVSTESVGNGSYMTMPHFNSIQLVITRIFPAIWRG